MISTIIIPSHRWGLWLASVTEQPSLRPRCPALPCPDLCFLHLGSRWSQVYFGNTRLCSSLKEWGRRGVELANNIAQISFLVSGVEAWKEGLPSACWWIAGPFLLPLSNGSSPTPHSSSLYPSPLGALPLTSFSLDLSFLIYQGKGFNCSICEVHTFPIN